MIQPSQTSFRALNLRLQVRGTVLRAIRRVEMDLRRIGINMPVRYWISTEWFTPDGAAGIAIPFYVLRKDLAQLERQMTGHAEGATYREAVRILRHEMAHVLDNAFHLRRRKDRQRIFGKSSKTYPSRYHYRPQDSRYVKHLEAGYAQAHPCEDFAETFAVWLDPRSNWRKRYAGTPALKKLEYVDSLMTELKQRRPKLGHRRKVDSIGQQRGTLADHYKLKNRRLKRTQVRPEVIEELRKLKALKRAIAKQNKKSIRYNPSWKEDLKRALTRTSGRHPELVRQYLEKLQKQAIRQGLNLNRVVQLHYPATKGILAKDVKTYFRQGRHQILL